MDTGDYAKRFRAALLETHCEDLANQGCFLCDGSGDVVVGVQLTKEEWDSFYDAWKIVNGQLDAPERKFTGFAIALCEQCEQCVDNRRFRRKIARKLITSEDLFDDCHNP